MAEPSEAQPSNTVLIAVDGSDEAMGAFNYYLEAMYKPEDNILLLHCPEYSDWNYKLLKGEEDPFIDWMGLYDEDLERVRELQEKFEDVMKEKGVKGTFECEPSVSPGQGIIQIAEDRKAKYIVTGTRGQGVLRRTIMGSVSDYVLNHSHVPVAIYRKEKPEGEDAGHTPLQGLW